MGLLLLTLSYLSIYLRYCLSMFWEQFCKRHEGRGTLYRMPDHHSLTSASEGAVFVFSDGEKDVAFTMILGLAEGTPKSCRVLAG